MRQFILCLTILCGSFNWSFTQPTNSQDLYREVAGIGPRMAASLQASQLREEKASRDSELLYRFQTNSVQINIAHSQYELSVYKWQLFSTRIIFVTVIIIVFSGLLFSTMQFSIAWIHARNSLKSRKAQAQDSAMAAGPVSTFKASLQGIEVSSSVLGIVVLGIALAFFYLYLAHVYPINDLSLKGLSQPLPLAEALPQ